MGADVGCERRTEKGQIDVGSGFERSRGAGSIQRRFFNLREFGEYPLNPFNGEGGESESQESMSGWEYSPESFFMRESKAGKNRFMMSCETPSAVFGS